MSPSHITEWTTNVTMTYNWVSNKCHLTQLYFMVTFVAHSVICDGDICCSLSYVSNKCHHDIYLSEQQMSPSHTAEWAKNVTITYNWVSNKCLLTQLYVMVTFVAHSVICDGDICCSLSYMWWWHLLLTQIYVMVTFVVHSVICDDISEWATNVTITYSWVSKKCHHHI
jgi:hypothetical protein